MDNKSQRVVLILNAALLLLLLLLPFAAGKNCNVVIQEEKRDPLLRQRIGAVLDQLSFQIANKIVGWTAGFAQIILQDTNTAGIPPLHVHALAWCAADVLLPACIECVTTIIGEMKTNDCPLRTGMRRIRFDLCVVRYQVGLNFLGNPDTGHFIWDYKGNNVPFVFVYNFDSKIRNFLRELIFLTLKERKQYKVIGKKVFPSLRKEMEMVTTGIVQCSGDQMKDSCRKCLDAAMAKYSKVCGGRMSCYVISETCIIKHSTSMGR